QVVTLASVDFQPGERARVRIGDAIMINDFVIAGAGVHDDLIDTFKRPLAVAVARDRDAAGAVIGNDDRAAGRAAPDVKRVAGLPGGTRAGARFEDVQARPDLTRS